MVIIYMIKGKCKVSSSGIHTNFSSGSNFKYLWIKRIIELTGLSASTAHLRVFKIGTFPVAFSSISTVRNKDRQEHYN